LFLLYSLVFFQILVIVIFSLVFGIGVWGTTQVKDGLDLTDVVPRGTSEYSFLEAQSKYFGFFHFYAVTQVSVSYPTVGLSGECMARLSHTCQCKAYQMM
jgi:hypothetical protein